MFAHALILGYINLDKYVCAYVHICFLPSLSLSIKLKRNFDVAMHRNSLRKQSSEGKISECPGIVLEQWCAQLSSDRKN